ncbi:MAG: UPF0175 family protein [Dehalococcoidia bacterium]
MVAVPSFDVPEEALRALHLTPEEFAGELRLAAAAFWYDQRQISQEIGANIAGLNRRDFILGLSRLKVDVLQVIGDELKRELAHVRELAHARADRREQLTPDHPHASGNP